VILKIESIIIAERIKGVRLITLRAEVLGKQFGEREGK